MISATRTCYAHEGFVATIAISKSPVIPPCTNVAGACGEFPCAQSNRKWILIASILGSSLAFMDGSVVNVSLPALQSSFHATSGAIQWVMQGYALLSASLLLLGGSIGDQYGRRRTFLWGIAIFTLASLVCACSASLWQLVAARAIQGVGAALLIPQGLSILTSSFAPDQRSGAIGTWSAWTSVFSALGPVTGGWLMQLWSWRLIFLLNLPIALVVFSLAHRIPESRVLREENSTPSLDRLGAVLATAGLAAIIYSLSFAPESGWNSPVVLWTFAIGTIFLAAFLLSQSKRGNAMMPLSFFRRPRFLAANLLSFLLYGALGGALYMTPFYLIQVQHYAPASAGAVFLPLIALMFVFSSRVGDLVPRIGERTPVDGWCNPFRCGIPSLCVARWPARIHLFNPARSALVRRPELPVLSLLSQPPSCLLFRTRQRVSLRLSTIHLRDSVVFWPCRCFPSSWCRDSQRISTHRLPGQHCPFRSASS